MGHTDHYVVVDDNTWPVRVGDIEWLLRYGNRPLTRSEQLIAASTLNAYSCLADPAISQKDAIAKLKRARRAAVRAAWETEHNDGSMRADEASQ